MMYTARLYCLNELEEAVMNLPNKLTVLRLILVPPILIVMLLP